ncbi:HEAT repeat domain-containing protein [Candidatus Poribacteria bacterium]|nr:HEAT repeat domain-containing protein [Candidatus Poribacteria bacterium]
MTITRTFGRQPTLAEMNEYYARDDVLDFLYDECQRRNIDIAFRKKRWPIKPTSKAHLKEIIDDTIEQKIKKAYQLNAGNIDSIRLEKYDYLSFHAHTCITKGKKLLGFDLIFEADMQGWRRAFEDLCGVVKILDGFDVCYRIKYSGVRSLHLMIPFETFPQQFNGESILSQCAEIHSKIQNYFRRHGGMEKAHGGGVLRLAYSLNEDNGLVSLPILSHQLSDFRPWEANIYQVTIDKPWHGDVPANASRKMFNFLREVYDDDAKANKPQKKQISFGLEISEKKRSNDTVPSNESIDQWTARLKSDEPAVRVEAAFSLMTAPNPVSESVLKAGLSDHNPDVRWFLAESLQKRLASEAIELAGKLLWDDDQFVRISAIDALALSGENSLPALSNAMSADISASMEALNDVVYAIHKICPEGEPNFFFSEKKKFHHKEKKRKFCESKAVQSFVEANGDAIARFLQNTIDSGQPYWRVRGYIRQLRELCKQYSIAEIAPFRESIKILVPRLLKSFSSEEPEYHQSPLPKGAGGCSILQEIRKNQAIPLMTMREIADSFGIDTVKIPSNRMPEEERAFLTQVVRESLIGMTVEQKARILVMFWLHSTKKLSEPAGSLLLYIDKSAAATAITQAIARREFWAGKLKGAVELLKHIDPSAAESVTEWMDDVSFQLSVVSNEASRKLAQEKDIDELVEMLASQSWSMRRNAADALSQKCESNEEIGKVIDVLRHKNYKAREAALFALGAMSRHAQARAAIAGALNAPYWQVRRDALKIYLRLNPPDAIDVLFHIIQRRDSRQVKLAAVKELGRYMNDEQVVHKLKDIHADGHFNQRIRTTAERLLRKIPK